MPAPPRRNPDPAAPAPHRPGRTSPQVSGEPAPRLPHEHDESSDSQHSPPREEMQRAHDDVKRGVVDTSRGDVSDEVYNRTLRGSTPPPKTPARR